MKSFADPIEQFRAVVAAVNAADWQAAAACCDAHSLREFHTQLCERYAPTTSRPVPTVEQLLQLNSAMPREVAEYEVSQYARRYLTMAEEYTRDLPGIADAQALRSATPEQAFSAWLHGRSPRRQIEQLMAAGHATHAAVAQLKALAADLLQLTPIGAVHDGDHIVHVLYRHGSETPAEPLPSEVESLSADERQYAVETWGRLHPEVVSARRQPDGSWRLVAEHGFLSLGAMTFALLPESENAGQLSASNEATP